MASLTAQMNPSVSLQSLKFPGSAPLTRRVEVMRMLEWGGIGLQQLLLQRLHWQDCSEGLRIGFGVASSEAEAAEGALAGC